MVSGGKLLPATLLVMNIAKGYVPVAVGVPDRVPPEDSVRPGGGGTVVGENE
jgi:hypothetical protein